MKKSGFTLIEILIVIVLLSLIFLMTKNLFILKNKDTLYGENCVESVYGDIANYATNAITSKGISIGNTILYPKQYQIIIQPSTNKVIFKYVSGDNLVYTASTDELTGSIPSSYYCKTSSYNMSLSGNAIDIYINKGLQQDQNLQSFIVSGAVFTGMIEFRQLSATANAPKKLIGTISVDMRTQIIQRKLCLNIDTSGDCLERNK